jgi:hypothetical protein
MMLFGFGALGMSMRRRHSAMASLRSLATKMEGSPAMASLPF